jgi:18S rRNA (guanine1575-N7)-methyltransferase
MGKKAKERPEHTAPPEIFYDADEAAKYTANTRVAAVQAKLTERALELLALPPPARGGGGNSARPCLLLDLGCGSGLSGEAIAAAGHHWVGMDIAPAMLDVAMRRAADSDSEEEEDSEEGDSDDDGPHAAAAAAEPTTATNPPQPPCRPPRNGDLSLADLGHGLPVRAGTFDGAVSISAVQWLCNADRASHDPRRRMRLFFAALYRSLRRGARAVLQIYPEGPAQAEMLVAAAMRAGFGGGLVVDYPHSTRAKKYFLVLMAGGGGGGGGGAAAGAMPRARGEDGSDEDDFSEDEGDDSMEVSSEEDGGGRRRGGKMAGGGGASGVQVVGRRKHHHHRGGKHGGGGGGGGLAKKSRAWVLRKKEQARGRGLGTVRPDTKYTGRKRHKSRK